MEEKDVEENEVKLTEKGVANMVTKAFNRLMKKKEEDVDKSKKEDEIAEYLKEKLGVDDLDMVKDILKKSKKEEKNVEKKKTDSPDIDSIVAEKVERERKKLQKQIEALKKSNEEKELAEKKRKISDSITENLKQNTNAYGMNEMSIELVKDALCENSDIDENGQIIFKDLDGSVKLNNKGENYSIGDAVTDLKKVPKYSIAFGNVVETSGFSSNKINFENFSNSHNDDYIDMTTPFSPGAEGAKEIYELVTGDITGTELDRKY